ncbi:(2Fe-2S)-binding protein [uncultured Sphaerochaeta sp.]|uniref:(2Fe-2S)-binding protein n=1 Tax=uncultured Sphaerochaeta sp. TaxID=886478 RepID=UPI002A0A39CB|nr:(2Fe-2S)-binding protein [uncultured Sphaerochaeta sp.]
MENNLQTVHCTVNGKPITKEVALTDRLLDLLRNQLGLTGTKEGCAIGECGACTVLLNGEPVQSCMLLALQVEGKQILTIEGISGPNDTLHPIQQAFLDAGAVQCGFCTPAMVLNAYALLMKTPHPEETDIRQAISGTLCRCTGYSQIIEAVSLASQRMYPSNQ